MSLMNFENINSQTDSGFTENQTVNDAFSFNSGSGSGFGGQSGFGSGSGRAGAMPLEVSLFMPQGSLSHQVVRAWTWGVWGIWGMLSNSLCAVAIIMSDLRKSWTYNMILNLCISDLLNCANAVIFKFPAAIMGRYPFGTVCCHISMALVFIPQNITLLSFLITAIHRYKSIVLAQAKWHFLERKWQPLLIVSIWIVAFGLGFPYAYPGLAFVSYWRDNCVIFATAGSEVMRFITSISVFAPSIIVFILYLHIFIVVRNSAKKVATASSKTSGASRRMALILFILYITFIIIFLPFTIFYNVISLLSLEIQEHFFIIGTFLLMLVSSCNPVLYGVLFKDIRKEYCRRYLPFLKNQTNVMELTHTS